MNVQLFSLTHVLVNMEDIVGWLVFTFFSFLPLDFLLGISEEKVNETFNQLNLLDHE